MKKLLIILSFYSTCSWSMESFTIIRNLGTTGKTGTQILQLLCTQENCQLSSAHNDHTSERATLTLKEASSFFKSAQVALKMIPDRESTSQLVLPKIVFIYEKGSLKNQSKISTPELLLLENKLQKRLGP